jgi:molybdopterin synthase catalytic subunit
MDASIRGARPVERRARRRRLAPRSTPRTRWYRVSPWECSRPPGYDARVPAAGSDLCPPEGGRTWCGLAHGELPIAAVYEWCVQPDCGAVVLFSGTVRDHAADGTGTVRTGVTFLEYEAYEEEVGPKLEAIALEISRRWPSAGRIALLHRIGRLDLGVSSVVVAVSAAHRPEAFEAARFGIDTLKATVPIWKRESWEDEVGSQHAWGLGAKPVQTVADLAVEDLG